MNVHVCQTHPHTCSGRCHPAQVVGCQSGQWPNLGELDWAEPSSSEGATHHKGPSACCWLAGKRARIWWLNL